MSDRNSHLSAWSVRSVTELVMKSATGGLSESVKFIRRTKRDHQVGVKEMCEKASGARRGTHPWGVQRDVQAEIDWGLCPSGLRTYHCLEVNHQMIWQQKRWLLYHPRPSQASQDPSCGGPVLLLTLMWSRTVFGPVIGLGSGSSAQHLGLGRRVGPDPGFHWAPLNLNVQAVPPNTIMKSWKVKWWKVGLTSLFLFHEDRICAGAVNSWTGNHMPVESSWRASALRQGFWPAFQTILLTSLLPPFVFSALGDSCWLLGEG